MTPVSVFINEIGTINGAEFVEVSYSSILGSRIANYSFYLYSGDGMVLDSASLSEGTRNLNGLTFTYVTYDAEAIALVNAELEEVLFFLSNGDVVTAVDGPAEGMDSTNIMELMGNENNETEIENTIRTLQEGNVNETVEPSISLIGIGCEFDEFVFGVTSPTPGDVNVGQEIRGCHGASTEEPSAAPAAAPAVAPAAAPAAAPSALSSAAPSAAPSATPSIRSGATDGISTGGIVAISVSSVLLVAVLFYLFRRQHGGEQEATIEEDPVTFKTTKRSFDIETGEEFMADTGDVEENSVSTSKSKRSGNWWNSVYWTSAGGADAKSFSDEAKKDEDVASPEIQFSPVDSSEPAGAGAVTAKKDKDVASLEIQFSPVEGSEPVGTGTAAAGLAVGAAAGATAETEKKQKRPLFRRSTNNSSTRSEETRVSAGDVGATSGVRNRTVAMHSTLATADASAIALSRRGEDRAGDAKSLNSADVTSEALENLDAALDNHDWNAIYNITAKMSKTDEHTASGSKRKLLGFAAGSRGASKSVADALSSDSESDAGGSGEGKSAVKCLLLCLL